MLTVNDLNKMTEEERHNALSFSGDKSKWQAPKSVLHKIGRIFVPGCHLPCGGKFREFASSGFAVLRIHLQCDRCGAIQTLIND